MGRYHPPIERDSTVRDVGDGETDETSGSDGQTASVPRDGLARRLLDAGGAA
jgi:hypothetical protein